MKLILIICILITKNCYCQFKNITQKDGLPSNEVYCVFKDSKNYLWFSTDQGVVRFNGTTMERFILPDNVIFKIKEDSLGKIYFFSHSGTISYFFNNKIYQFKNLQAQNKFSDILISEVVIIDFNTIFISTITGTDFIIKNNSEVKKCIYNNGNSDTATISIEKSGKNVFFSRVVESPKTKINYLKVIDNTENKKSETIIPIDISSGYFRQKLLITPSLEKIIAIGSYIIKIFKNQEYIIKKLPSEILCLSYYDNQVSVGLFRNGLFKIDNNFKISNEIEFFKGKSVTDLVKDFENGLWVTTLEQGIFYAQNKSLLSLDDRLIGQNIFRVANYQDKFLVFANKSGVYKYQYGLFTQLKNINLSTVSDIFLKNKKLIIVGIASNYLDEDKRKKYRNTTTNNFNFKYLRGSSELFCDSNKNFFYFNGTSLVYGGLSKHENPIRTKEFPKSKVYLNSKGSKFVFDSKNLYEIDSYLNTKSKINVKEGITTMRNLNIYTIAIGHKFGGISFLKNNILSHTITEKDGLINNSIKYLLPLKNQLWVATANGISIIKFSDTTFLNYNISNITNSKGLSDIIIHQLLSFKGNILAASSNGILVIKNPDSLINSTPLDLPLYINSIKYNQIDTCFIPKLSLPFKNNSVNISFNAISYSSFKELKYYYKISKTDSTWTETTSTKLILENLAPGNYNIQIRAGIPEENRYSSKVEIEVTILKPYWQRNLFRLALGLILFLLMYLIIKWRIKVNRVRDRNQLDVELQILELEQKALRAQMNPHFIFNCLSSIQQLIVFKQNEEANLYLTKFADLIRTTLEISSDSSITIDNEINYLEKYIKLEQLRLPNQIKYFIETDKNISLSEIEIPSMILQPIVENAIRHGIKNREDNAGKLDIKFKKSKFFIFCTVSDNGNGLPDNFFINDKRVGLKNVIQRLKALNNTSEDHLFKIENIRNINNENIGTIVKIKLPILNSPRI
jgi:hypothetical protein